MGRRENRAGTGRPGPPAAQGPGVGASHQTGWTGLVARIIQLFGYMSPEQVLGEEARRLVYRKAGSAPQPVEGPAAR